MLANLEQRAIARITAQQYGSCVGNAGMKQAYSHEFVDARKDFFHKIRPVQH